MRVSMDKNEQMNKTEKKFPYNPYNIFKGLYGDFMEIFDHFIFSFLSIETLIKSTYCMNDLNDK